MISYDELQKTIFDFSYGAALGDAIGQKAFEGNKKPLRKNEDAKNIAQTYIDAILEGKNPDFYETAKVLKKSFETYIKNNINAIKYIKKDNKIVLFNSCTSITCSFHILFNTIHIL